jgi:hypothetical protein
MLGRTVTVFGLALWVASAWSLSAQAQACSADGDCQKGFSCVVVAAVACPASAPCEPGQKCAELPPCVAPDVRACQPAECSTDSDCADGMVCQQEVAPPCGGAPAVTPCPPGQTCPAIVPSCPEPKHVCTPRYQLPCSQAADCGDGFDCIEERECSCSGSSGMASAGVPVPEKAAPPVAADAGQEAAPVPAAPPSAGAARVPVPPPSADAGTATPKPVKDGGSAQPLPANDAAAPVDSCECHASGIKSCEAKDIACTQDSDCPSLFKCSPRIDGTVAVSCAASPDGGVSACDSFVPPPAQPQTLHCELRYGDPTRGVSAHADDSLGATASGAVPQAATPTTTDSPGAAPPTENAAQTTDQVQPASGCSVSRPGLEPSHSRAMALGWLTALTGIALSIARRRRQ